MYEFETATKDKIVFVRSRGDRDVYITIHDGFEPGEACAQFTPTDWEQFKTLINAI